MHKKSGIRDTSPQKISWLLFVLIIFRLALFAEGSVTQHRLTQDDYIEKYKHIAIQNMRQYGIPASITLAQGILESASGNSDLAREANNHFGIKCHTGWTGRTFHKDDDAKNECFRAYRKAEESFADHAIFLSTRGRYAALFELDITDYKGWARGLRAAGYATNPAYAERLITLIERHELYRFDQPGKEHAIADSDKTLRPESRDRGTSTRAGSTPVNTRESASKEASVLQTNGVKYVRAIHGETLQQLADRLDIRPWMLRRYNDLDKEQEISAGEKVFIQSKKRKGENEVHTVKAGETLHYISQQYAVRLSRLMRLNDLHPDDPLDAGSTIRLR